jgi:hypothetical protein
MDDIEPEFNLLIRVAGQDKPSSWRKFSMLLIVSRNAKALQITLVLYQFSSNCTIFTESWTSSRNRATLSGICGKTE